MNGAFNACLASHPYCRLMDAIVRSCTLIIGGQRYVGFEYVAEFESDAKSLGFISGPANVLRRARLRGPVQIQFAGGSLQDVSIVAAHRSGLALIAFDPNSGN
jgi:hypothetical protein